MINQEQIAAYREMAKNASANGMEAQIKANLEETCDKFAGNEDKFERCISYLEECAQEILEGKNGDVPDEVCFRICRDYFNDEIWKAEDEENEREKAEEERREKEKAEKEKNAPAKSANTKKKAPAKPTNPEPEPEPENKATDEPPKKEHTTEAVPAMDADGQYCLF
jgi:outer membrane biosynthesis protein TonB